MADQNSTTNITNATSSLLNRFQLPAPNPAQAIGLLVLFITGGVLLCLAGLTVTATVMGIIFFSPLIIISSPVWFPLAAVLIVSVVGFVSVCGFGITAIAGFSWVYRYLKGMNPPGSGRIDYARSRISDTATHVKDYAREFGYLHTKTKDAAPGA